MKKTNLAIQFEALEDRKLMSTYYVSTGGNDSAGGGQSAPWKTLQKAANSVVAGDTVHVLAGTYNVGMNLYGKGGTSSNPIRFLADPGVVITHAATSGTNASLAGINIEQGSGNIVIDGFKIVSDGSMQRAGIRVALASNVQITNNTIQRAYIGIFAGNASNITANNNVCFDSTDQHGIYFSGVANFTIRGNDLYNNNWDGLHLNVNGDVMDSGGLIENNKIHNNVLSGMDVQGTTTTTFRNNIIYNNTKHGISIHNLDQAGCPASTNNVIVNNTITGNGLYGIQMAAGGNTANTLFNNILLATSTTYGAIGIDGSASGLVSDYNVVVDRFSNVLAAGKMSLSQWRSTTGQDAHSVISDPGSLFNSSSDYHLKSGAAAVDKGVSSLNGKAGPTTDFDGLSRPSGSAFDVGAFERGGGGAPVDTTPPTISSVNVTGIGSLLATINWTTNESADQQVEYGTTTSYGLSSALNLTLGTSHIVALTGLSANTTYHYRVKSRDAAGNLQTSGDFTFNTSVASDTTAPVISSVSATGITTAAATINWNTNEAANTQVEYGTTTSYGSSTTLNSTLSTGHSASISGLLANTTYHYRVKSRDAAGNLQTSGDFTFKTNAVVVGDVTPPVISAVSATGMTTSGVNINWTTNEAADQQVEYGTTASYGTMTALNLSMWTNHVVTMGGLNPNTTYHYRVRSRDAAGNLQVSGDFTFATAAPVPADPSTPSVVSGAFVYQTSPNKITFKFNKDVSASLHKGDIAVRLQPSGAHVDATAISYDLATNTATWTLPTMVDGNYTVTLLSAGVLDAAGNRVASDYTFSFFVLRGDANHDRRVDVQDMNIMLGNWMETGKTFAQGDLDYDGDVDRTDLGILSGNWQKVLA